MNSHFPLIIAYKMELKTFTDMGGFPDERLVRSETPVVKQDYTHKELAEAAQFMTRYFPVKDMNFWVYIDPAITEKEADKALVEFFAGKY